MGFGSMIHRSHTGEVRKQDIINVIDYLVDNAKMIMYNDGTCDIYGNVDVSGLGIKSLKQLTPNINTVYGSFLCNNNELKDLDGAPKEVTYDLAAGKPTSLDVG